jgi:GNAT superfamily N-acetyltransferase
MSSYLLREATVGDARILAEYRRLMFTAMGQVAPGEGDDLVSATHRYLEREIPTGQVRAWIVDLDGQPVAGGIIVLQVPAPTPGFVSGESLAAIQNIWTDPEHRRRGLAGRIVQAMIAWCREHGVHRLFLNATEDGRGVYTEFGFRPSTTAMTLTLTQIRQTLPRRSST